MRFRFLNNLMFKLALGFLLVSLVPLSFVSGFALHTANRVIETIVTSQLENMAAEKQRLLERWMDERRADLEVVAASAAARSMEVQTLQPYLELVQSKYRVYSQFVVAGADGRTVFVSQAAGAADWKQATWYQRAIHGQPYMSEVYLAADNQESVFELANPVLTADGHVQGVVCASVSTKTIAREVLSVSLGQTGECYLVDGGGTFLAHQDARRILRDNIARSESFTNVFREPGTRRVYRDYRGISVLGASRSIAGTPWYVVVEQDEDEAFAAAYVLRRNIWVAWALTIVGAVACSGLLAHFVTAPVRALHHAAQALGAADYQRAVASLPAPRGDEIGTLRDAFEEMARLLRERELQLQDRVGLTEAELQKADVRLQRTIAAAARSEHLAALGRLASGVAHEIRTPLTSLKLYLQSVQDDFTTSAEQAEDFEIAMRQVTRIAMTINHFLNFARPQDPILSVLDFRQLVEESLIVVRPRANHQSVEVQTSIAPHLPRVEGDARQLGEVLVNLTVNALEAMPQGGQLRITVTAEPSGLADRATPGVRIDVADNGLGIREEDRALLFEPFFTTKATGSGLGLAIVHGTVERHGGSLQVRTEVGSGTTFSIFLPATAEPNNHGQSPDRG